MHATRHTKSFDKCTSIHISRSKPAIRGTDRRIFLGHISALIALSAGGTLWPAYIVGAAKKVPQQLVKYQGTPKNNRKCAD